MDLKTQNELNNCRAQMPQTWQYWTLRFQESAIATTMVFGIVLFELIFVGSLRDEEDTHRENTNTNYSYEPSFYWGLGVSGIFLAEILLRYYTWSHTVAQIEAQKLAARSHMEGLSPAAAASKVGGFFSNKFRALDSFLVVLDLILFVVEIVMVTSEVDAKATTKLARVLRLARSAKWIGRLKVLRSFRFIHRLGVAVRQFGQPTGQNVYHSLREAMTALEEASDGWEDASPEVSERIKADLGRNTSKVLDAIDKRAMGIPVTEGGGSATEANARLSNSDVARRLVSSEATLAVILEKISTLESVVMRNGRDALSREEGAEGAENLSRCRIPVKDVNDNYFQEI